MFFPGQRNASGLTALQLAVNNQHSSVVTLLHNESQVATKPEFTKHSLSMPYGSGTSLQSEPGSGSEGDTESILDYTGDKATFDMYTNNNSSKLTFYDSIMQSQDDNSKSLSKIPAAIGLPAPMPKIPDPFGKDPPRKDFRHILEEDYLSNPSRRPPTPARSTLPVLTPSLSSSQLSIRSVSPTRKNSYLQPITKSSVLTRSTSEPQSLHDPPPTTVEPILSSSSKSDMVTWDQIKLENSKLSNSSSGGFNHISHHHHHHQQQTPTSVVSLPPIRSTYSVATKNKQTHKKDPDNVLSNAKKTLTDINIKEGKNT